MRVPSNLQRGDLGINMTPMIDVVFQLIIFFLVSSHLAKQESHLPLPLPTAVTGEEDLQADEPQLTINVRADGTLAVGGKPLELDRLVERLRERRVAVGDALEVRIRSDRSVPYRQIQPILSACAGAEIWKVSFAVYRPEDTR